jgi:hypothetical protein
MPSSINGTAGYNIGTDASVVVSDNFGDVFPLDALGHVMDIDTEATDAAIKIVPISNGGVPVHQVVWEGGTGSFSFTRVNGNLQRMILDLMDAYHSQGVIPQFQLSISILNRDGTVDEYLYTGVQFTKPAFGNFKAMKEVDQKLAFVWSNCVATGGSAPFLANLAAAA